MQERNISIQNNMILMMGYRIIVTVAPLITTPYISRVLLPETIGNYSYTQSVCAYFGTFAALGSSIYGQREIAFIRDDKIACSKTFWEIIVIRLVMTLISCGVYLYLVINYFDVEIRLYFLIQVIDLFSGLLDISWLFFGLECFSKVFMKNLFLKLITIGCIFAFVKGAEDIYVYIVINSVALVLSSLVFWVGIHRHIKYISITNLQFAKHLWPMLTLFFPSVAATLYNKLDITMLSVLYKVPAETACYEQTVKISTLSATSVAMVGSVIAPRLAYIYSNDSKEQLKKYFWKGFDALCIIGVPVSFGLYAVADTLIPWFLGSQYIKVVDLLQLMAPLCLLAGMNNYIGAQYLVVTKRQTKYTSIILIGVAVNILCNYFFIPLYGSAGAIIASIISELSILIVEIYTVRNEIDILEVLNIMPKKFLSAVIMCICVKIFSLVSLKLMLKVMCQVLLGIAIYAMMLFRLKDSLTVEIAKKIWKHGKE